MISSLLSVQGLLSDLQPEESRKEDGIRHNGLQKDDTIYCYSNNMSLHRGSVYVHEPEAISRDSHNSVVSVPNDERVCDDA